MRERIWQVSKLAFLAPLALLVLSDYVTLLVWWVKILLCAYILLQAVALVAGVIIGMLKLTEKDNKWIAILDYKIVKLFPTISLGSEVFAWAMSSASEESESESPEPETLDLTTPEPEPCQS